MSRFLTTCRVGNLRSALILLFGFWTIQSRAASPTLDYLFPPGLKQGSNAILTIGGKFDPWPVSAWVDCSGVTFEAQTNSGKFDVHVAKEASLGPHLLRIYSKEGASAPRWFVITREQDELEKEPNDSVKQAQPIDRIPIVIAGRLEKSGDVDSFAVKVEAGKWLVARVDAFSLGSPVDAVLHLLNEQGVRLAFNHDSGRSLDPLLAYKIEKSGTYILQIAGFAHPPASDVRYAGSAATIYRLTITAGPFVNHVFPAGVQRGQKAPRQLLGWNLESREELLDASIVPVEEEQLFVNESAVDNRVAVPIGDLPEQIEIEPNNSVEQAQLVSHPCAVNGRISIAGDEDRFRFSAQKGERFDFQIQSALLGFPLDATLTITDTTGGQLARADDSGGPDPKLNWTAPTNGSYVVAVNDLFHKGGDDFVYRLLIAPPKPDFKVTVSEHAIRLEPGKTNEFKLDVTRINGHTNTLLVAVEDLPDSVSVRVPDISAKSGEVKVAFMAGSEAKPVNQPFRISVRAKDSGAPKVRRALFELKGKESPGHRLINYTEQLWLTVVSKSATPSATQ